MNSRTYLLPETGRFYKANLHSHTVISDGRLTPEEAKEHYKKHGYQIMAFTDHRIYRNHEELNDEEFLALAAVEVDINEVSSDRLRPEDKTYHINCTILLPVMSGPGRSRGYVRNAGTETLIT